VAGSIKFPLIFLLFFSWCTNHCSI